MIHQALPWLPPAADGAFERQLATLAAQWARQWLRAGGSLTVARADPAGSLSWHGCPAAATGIAADALVALGQEVVAGRGDLANSRDCEILGRIGAQAVSDLRDRVRQIAAPAEASEPLYVAAVERLGPAYRVSRAGWSLMLALAERAQVRLRREIAGARTPAALGSRQAALAPAAVRLGCHLGQALLAAADVTALAPGDLIVLDRRITDALPLTAEGRMATRGTATIETAAGAQSVRIGEAMDLAAGDA